ncbi:MAG TPA: hypothetical protein VG012_01465 [Acidimicrobiia bacterium]|nr:hypothetical protein [Acidimicrobiia bacterium]
MPPAEGPAPRRRWARPSRRGRWTAGVALVAVAVAGTVLGLVLTVGSGSSRAASATSYCQAAKVLTQYAGHDAARIDPLLTEVAARAPHDIAPEVHVMRSTRIDSTAYRTARQAWTRYDTNHCCTCIGGPNMPQVLVPTTLP